MRQKIVHKDHGRGSLPDQGLSSHELLRRQLFRFSLTLIVMAVSLALYYLGLFGQVQGPLQPAHIGEKLNSWGLTRMHVLFFCLFLCCLSLTWNWIYNGISRLVSKKNMGLSGTDDFSKTLQLRGQGKHVEGQTLRRDIYCPVKKGKYSYTCIGITLCLLGVVVVTMIGMQS